MNTVVIGNFYGDEAKGRLVDYLAPNFKYVVRCSGGANAGHTIIVNGTKYVTRLVPSAILHENIKCVLGQGMVIDPEVLLSEINTFNITKDKLLISENAHIVLPWQKHIDEMRECGELKIGTTKKGIGPCYEEKTRRSGVRMIDLKLGADELMNKLAKSYLSWGFDMPPVNQSKLARDLLSIAEKCNITDTSHILNSTNDPILFEGAQGTMLDINNGTYPYVTSSVTTIGGIISGAGVSHKKIGKVIGCIKAYNTRVGDGPFTTEIEGELAETLRKAGNEYGSVTGRPRRVGWLDIEQVNKAIQLNGVDEIAMAKLDVLSALDEIKVRIDDTSFLTFKGWKTDISSATQFEDLPFFAQAFVKLVEGYLKAPIAFLSVNPERNSIIELALNK